MKLLLIKEDLWSVIEEKEPEDKSDEWKRKDRIAFSNNFK
jgi:hypothetical protein